MNADFEKLASKLPDNQLLLDTRGSLLSRPCELFGQTKEDFVIRRFDAPLICVFGKPAISAIQKSVSKSVQEVEVLTYQESLVQVSSALNDWPKEAAIIHEFSNPPDMKKEIDGQVRLADEDELSWVRDDFPELAKELLDAAPHSPIAAFFVENRPVSFCFSTCESESLWDVSIETLPNYQRKGFAECCARFMIRYMLKKGKQPSWGALESNISSLNLAQKLGFVPVGELFLFSRPPHKASKRFA